jgi:predicted O-linked N-acetylglucosamine transferase (SPINDLY family)
MPSMSQAKIERAMQIAMEHHRAGRLGQAESGYREVLANQPSHAEALHLLGVLAGQTGRLDEATDLIRRAIAAAPGNAVYHGDLGGFLQHAGKLDEAIGCYQQALRFKPDFAEAHFNLGVAWQQKGELDRAIGSFQRAVQLKPTLSDAHFQLGQAWMGRGEVDRAVACYQNALQSDPRSVAAHYYLGNAWTARGDPDRAIECYERALALQPDLAEAYIGLGIARLDKGQLTEAEADFQRALALRPECAEGHHGLGMVWGRRGQMDRAIACHEKALSLRSDYPEAHNNLGLAWNEKRELDKAIACYQRALAIRPGFAEAHCNLGNSLRDAGKFDEAIASYQQAIACNPGFVKAHLNLGNIWKDTGYIDLAIECCRRALAHDPTFISAHDNLIYMLHYHPAADLQSLLVESQRWNRQHAEPLKRFMLPHGNDRNPDRRLRVGYMSPDFRTHPVGRFILPLLASHDRAAVEVFCYSLVTVPDAMTAKLKPHADTWRSVVGQSDEQIARTIREDRIDILVDLAMHTAHNRLLVLARKPAPVQVTYLASLGGSGLDTIDYRLTDRYLNPDEADDRFYLEKSVRLSGTYWCYQPSDAAGTVNELPALTAGRITLGCLNNFAKVSQNTLEIWSRLLHRIPDSRMLLHSFPGSHRQRVVGYLNDCGIAADRLEIVGKVPARDYFNNYHRIDIALDPFPYPGGTTTCDTLWMGVPVVTLAGRTAIGRAGVSILSNIGHAELVAENAEHYIQIAVDLAGDLPRLAQMRATLREQMRNSPLMDEKGYARGVEAAYRTMWRNWCAQPSPSTAPQP